MSKIAPCIWFDGAAEEAAAFYTTLLPDSRIDRVMRTPSDTPGAASGAVLGVDFTVAGQGFMALNGGPSFKPTPGISFFVSCADQAEVDRLWHMLLDGGSAMQCGWLTDRYGVSWQIVPKRLGELLSDTDRARSARAMQAMMGMVKIDIAALEWAADGTGS